MLKSKFQEYLSACPKLKESTQHSLSHRVATCWNSDQKTLDDYLYLWCLVKMLTNNPGLNLNHFALDTTQRRLAEELNEALEVRFSPVLLIESHHLWQCYGLFRCLSSLPSISPLGAFLLFTKYSLLLWGSRMPSWLCVIVVTLAQSRA